MIKKLYIHWLRYKKRKHHKLHLRYSEKADSEMRYGDNDQACDHYLNMSNYHFKKYLKAYDKWLNAVQSL